MQYNERIRELREHKNKTQDEIAEVLKTNRTYYSKYENGKIALPIERLATLCTYYNVSADYILGLPKGLPYGERNTEQANNVFSANTAR